VECSYEALISAARAAAGTPGASAVLDPQWEGFMRPEDMTAAIEQYCGDSGQPAPTAPGEFAQVIFASLAESYAAAIAQLREKTARRLRNLYMIGGMARNEYLNQLTAERAGVEVLVGPAEATALGNVAVQVQAVG
jgi:rhamnulokinase